MTCTEIWLVIANWVLAIATWVMAASGYKLFRHTEKNSKEILRNEVIGALFREYRTPKMGAAVDALYVFFKKECEEDEITLIKKYDEGYEQMKADLEGLHYKRRRVSNFYQYIAALIYSLEVFKGEAGLFYTLWPRKSLRIIRDILVPMEGVAYKKSYGERMNDENMPEPIKNMLKLYRESLEYEQSLVK